MIASIWHRSPDLAFNGTGKNKKVREVAFFRKELVYFGYSF